MKQIIFSIFFLFYAFSIIFCENSDIIRQINVQQIKQAGEPLFTKDAVILTLPAADAGEQEIFLVTDLDDWEKPHYFETSLYGVYYCKLPYDKARKEFIYRLNINGFWTIAPNTPSTYTDNYGNCLARVSVPDAAKFFRSTPEIEEIEERTGTVKKVTFRVYAPQAGTVNLLCSCAGFSPFTYQMKKNDAGYWEISIPLSYGQYSYCYYIDNIRELDANNPQKTMTPELGRMSAFTIAQTSGSR